MGSSRSPPGYRRNPAPFSCAVRELFLHACHPPGTRLAKRYRIRCGKSPAAGRRHGGRNEAGSCRYKSLHRGENKPITMSLVTISLVCGVENTHPHGRMQGLGDFIVLLQSGTAPQYLGQPKLAHGTFHVTNLSLRWRGSSDPLGGFPAHAANHVGMSEGLGGPLSGFRIGLRRDGLRNAGVKRGGATRNDQGVFPLIAS